MPPCRCSRRLAATGRTDQRHALAGAQGQRYVLERWTLGAWVGEGHTVEFDQALGATEFFLATIRLGILIDQRKDALGSRQPTLIGALTSVRRFSGAMIISMAVTKETKLPTLVWSFEACRSATPMMMGTPEAAKSTSGDCADEAIIPRMAKRRCSPPNG